MRKITNEAVNAFLNDTYFNKQNMRVECNKAITGEKDLLKVTTMQLHGNTIAFRYIYYNEVKTFITSAGWFSNTTKERLNGLPGVRIHQKNYNWFLNGELWHGELKEIK